MMVLLSGRLIVTLFNCSQCWKRKWGILISSKLIPVLQYQCLDKLEDFHISSKIIIFIFLTFSTQNWALFSFWAYTQLVELSLYNVKFVLSFSSENVHVCDALWKSQRKSMKMVGLFRHQRPSQYEVLWLLRSVMATILLWEILKCVDTFQFWTLDSCCTWSKCASYGSRSASPTDLKSQLPECSGWGIWLVIWWKEGV